MATATGMLSIAKPPPAVEPSTKPLPSERGGVGILGSTAGGANAAKPVAVASPATPPGDDQWLEEARKRSMKTFELQRNYVSPIDGHRGFQSYEEFLQSNPLPSAPNAVAGGAPTASAAMPAAAPLTGSSFASMIYAGGANDEQATIRGLKHAIGNGWSPQQTADEWNSALGTSFTVDDYHAAIKRHGLGAQAAAAIKRHGLGAQAAAGNQPATGGGLAASLPSNWASYSPAQKIAYYNANGITPDQLMAGGASQQDLDWMLRNGYKSNDVVAQPGRSKQEIVEDSRRGNPVPVPGSDFAPNLDSQINPLSETIEGRIGNLLATDGRGNYSNPVVRQAVDRAMQQMAGRGLLNSSMAAQAGQEAAIAKAIEIAGPDAERYFQQGRANQDAQNVFARDEQGYAQDQSKLDKQLAFNREQLALDRDKFGESASQFTRNYALERDKLTQSGSQFNQELKYKYDSLNINSADRAAAESLAHRNALEINSITSVNSAYDLYLRRISDIDNNAEYSAEAKVQMKNQAGKDFDIYARAKGIALEMDLGNRFSAASGVAALPKPVAGMLASQGDYGQGGA